MARTAACPMARTAACPFMSVTSPSVLLAGTVSLILSSMARTASLIAVAGTASLILAGTAGTAGTASLAGTAGTAGKAGRAPSFFRQWAEASLPKQETACFASLVRPKTDRGPPPATAVPPWTYTVRTRTSTSKRGKNQRPQGQKSKPPPMWLEREQAKKQAREDEKAKRRAKLEEGSHENHLKVEILELKGPKYAPLQRRFEDIRVIQLDIKKEGFYERFVDFETRRYTRCDNIAPGCYYSKPITPHPNPSNPACRLGRQPFYSCGHSHYIIELLDTQAGEGVKVQLLIRDFDIYLVGFRRFMPGQGWSAWYFFSDLHLPEFLKDAAIKCSIGGSHEEIYDIGGNVSFRTVFTDFGKYPEHLPIDSFRKPALIAIFIFCEAFRDYWMHQALLERIRNNTIPMPFGYFMPDGNTGLQKYVEPDRVWKRIHSWSRFSGQCIEAGVKGGWFDADKELKDFDKIYEMTSFDEIIGLLSVLMRDDDYIGIGEEEVKKPGAGLDCPNPGFDNIDDKPMIVYN